MSNKNKKKSWEQKGKKFILVQCLIGFYLCY